MDTEFKQQIIGGLSEEVVERLKKRDGVSNLHRSPDAGCHLNSEELKIELDTLVGELNISIYLHTYICSPLIEDDRISAVFIENKDGRQAIKAKIFVDATGDGDIAAAAGIEYVEDSHMQPPTTCAKIKGLENLDMNEMLAKHREEFGLDSDSGWAGSIPGVDDIKMYAITHVFNTNAAKASDLTSAEIEGRRHVRALMDIARKYGNLEKPPLLLALASYIGVRESRRFKTEHILTEDEVLNGVRFDDAIANGSYRVDVHNTSGGGFVFKYLDGTLENCCYGNHSKGRWREETPENPTFYQIPYSTMHSRKCSNLLMAGRMIGTDRGAFGGVRVMVNLNQVGEAAGVAAAIALDGNTDVSNVEPARLRRELSSGGSIIF